MASAAQIPENLNFEEVVAFRGHRNMSAFGRACGLPRSVLSLYANGWPGAFPTRRKIKKSLQISEQQLNDALRLSWEARVRAIPREA